MVPTDVRPGRREDLPHLLELQASLSRPNPDLLSTALVGSGTGAGTVLVSVRDGRPVGYLLAIPGVESAHLAELAVAPGHRREGRASRLLARAVERLAADRITLAVAPDNRAARRCYERAGFEVVDRDPGYYDGDPAVIMERAGSAAGSTGPSSDRSGGDPTGREPPDVPDRDCPDRTAIDRDPSGSDAPGPD